MASVKEESEKFLKENQTKEGKQSILSNVVSNVRTVDFTDIERHDKIFL